METRIKTLNRAVTDTCNHFSSQYEYSTIGCPLADCTRCGRKWGPGMLLYPLDRYSMPSGRCRPVSDGHWPDSPVKSLGCLRLQRLGSFSCLR